jgi:hypothetical protein
MFKKYYASVYRNRRRRYHASGSKILTKQEEMTEEMSG